MSEKEAMKQVHGHEVLHRMLAKGETYTRESLCRDIMDAFGPDTRFHTCSADNLTAEELVAFLESKGKFVGQDGGFSTAPEKICEH